MLVDETWLAGRGRKKNSLYATDMSEILSNYWSTMTAHKIWANWNIYDIFTDCKP